MKLAQERIHFQGLPARICWLGYRRARRVRRGHERPGKRGEIKAPIVIGRDHLDTGSVASPFRETEGMIDGSDAIADWALLERAGEHSGRARPGFQSTMAAASASAIRSMRAWWWSRMEPMNLARRLERVLTSDPGMGVLRHADAGYSRAIEFASGHDIKIPMESPARD